MEQVAGYRLVALLGEGGMGRVHLARTASGRLAAVKTVHEHLAADPLFRERFRRETLAARAVAGPFTAAVLDAGPDAVRPWLATEFCAGPTLTQAAGTLGPLGAGPLAGLGAALAEALASIHRAGLVHRDLKPSNVVLTRGGPKVLDFGIARRAADETLTDTGEVIGSPGFIAPELLTADAGPSPATDVFALAALLARLATGRAPFGSGPAHQVLYRTVRGEADLDGAPTAEWRVFLASCLTGDPAERPTVAEVLSWCAERSPAGAWWERDPVSGLVRDHENRVAALVADAAAGRDGAGPRPARTTRTTRALRRARRTPDPLRPTPYPPPPTPRAPRRTPSRTGPVPWSRRRTPSRTTVSRAGVRTGGGCSRSPGPRSSRAAASAARLCSGAPRRTARTATGGPHHRRRPAGPGDVCCGPGPSATSVPPAGCCATAVRSSSRTRPR
ncbi:serine/threonine-protein kinase [Streptomyces sp. WAC00303]|uniref:serine/threonine-protein kinase n=1 Tax=Streptomyces sp. WAC00303 TaxID=2933779 RepID=UPI00204DC377|nr:serine/threonine-protein kinase [Streptomyces sp. WAC00303]UPT41219.1 serine/threonine protein kinase [Streptomyces sp. WAC00303]